MRFPEDLLPILERFCLRDLQLSKVGVVEVLTDNLQWGLVWGGDALGMAVCSSLCGVTRFPPHVLEPTSPAQTLAAL